MIYFIPDYFLPRGFTVRVGMSGDKAFYYVYRADKGRGAALRWLRLGAFPTISVEQARAIAKQKAAAVALGADPAQEVRESKAAPLVSAALEIFFTEHVEAKLKPASRRQYRDLIDNYIIPAIGKLQVTDVEHRHIAMLHHSMKGAILGEPSLLGGRPASFSHGRKRTLSASAKQPRSLKQLLRLIMQLWQGKGEEHRQYGSRGNDVHDRRQPVEVCNPAQQRGRYSADGDGKADGHA